MPAPGRVGDHSLAPNDEKRPAATGSADVLINNKAALRIGDKGADGVWQAVQGAPKVLINGKRLHRVGDQDQHREGLGRLVEGSPDVLIGEIGKPKKEGYRLDVVVADELGEPCRNEPYELKLSDGTSIRGTTDDKGRIHHFMPEGMTCTISIHGQLTHYKGTSSG